MAAMKLGSKPEAFQCDGHTWICKTGLPSDVIVEVADISFHLHKFPLLSRSGVLEKMIGNLSGEEAPSQTLQLHDIPGGAKSFEFVVKFCYGVKVEVTAFNVVALRCAAEHLEMTEQYGEGNLIFQTENFLNEVFGCWNDSIAALKTCEEVLPLAEELQIVSRCINSLAMKACEEPSLFSWPLSGCNMQNPDGNALWNGIGGNEVTPGVTGTDWWYEDASFLSLNLYKRLIMAVEARGMRSEYVAGSVMFYAERHLPGLNRHQNFRESTIQAPCGTSLSVLSESDQRSLLEEIVELLPEGRAVTSTKFLLGMLRTAMILHASPSCRENLERRVGAQLDQAELEDLLIPNLGESVETLYDIDCVQRILDHFISVDQAANACSPCITDEAQLMGSPHLMPMTMVAKLVDGYLAEVAPDVDVKFPKFQSLAATIPEYARQLDDGIYRAIDIYLKSHPWLTDSEREQLCRLMNCQKLSLEACTHAAQNERLPLRVVVQVLFFEQLRLRTSIAGWFFVSDNLENSNTSRLNLELTKSGDHQEVGPALDLKEASNTGMHEMRARVQELEKECMSMKEEIGKLGKRKSTWSILCRKLWFKSKQLPKNSRESSISSEQELLKE